MSREERRAYERMNRGRDPFAPPLSREAKARLDAGKQRREARRRSSGRAATSSGVRGGRFWRVLIGGALGAGLIGFSLAWPNGMPTALYVGLAVAVGWVMLAFGVRAVMRRASAGAPSDRRP